MISLVRNATWSGLSAAVRAATGLLIALLAVRLLGAGHYGQMATLLSLFVLFLSLNSSVFTVLVTKLMSAGVVDGEKKHADVLSAATILAFGSIVVLSLLTLLIWSSVQNILPFAAKDNDSVLDIQHAVLAMGLLTSFQIMTALYSSVIEGLGRLDLAMKWLLIGPLFVMAVLFLLLMLHVPISVSNYVAVLCCGALIDWSMLVLVRRKLLPSPVSLRLPREKWGQMWSLLKAGATLQAASLMTLFLEPMNKFLLNHFAGPLAVTAYDLAMKVIWGIQSLFAAAMRVFLHLSGEQGAVVGRAFSRVFTLILIPVLAAHVIAAVFLTWVIHHWVTIGDTRLFMTFFGIATLSNLGMIYVTPIYISLIGRGDMRFILRSQTIVAVTNVAVSLSLIPIFGLPGAALGLLCATAYNVVAIYLRHERTVGESGGLRHVFKYRIGRYVTTFMLLLAAILIGSAATVGLVSQLSILLITAYIIKGELIIGMLLERMRSAK